MVKNLPSDAGDVGTIAGTKTPHATGQPKPAHCNY